MVLIYHSGGLPRGPDAVCACRAGCRGTEVPASIVEAEAGGRGYPQDDDREQSYKARGSLTTPGGPGCVPLVAPASQVCLLFLKHDVGHHFFPPSTGCTAFLREIPPRLRHLTINFSSCRCSGRCPSWSPARFAQRPVSWVTLVCAPVAPCLYPPSQRFSCCVCCLTFSTPGWRLL